MDAQAKARKPKTKRMKADAYARHKEAMRQARREQSSASRDIAPLPACVDPARRESCRPNFRLFCETYYSQTFRDPWSKDHLTVIDRIERVVLTGGQFAIAMPRGYGKTSLCEAAALWALLYAHRRFVCIVGPSDGHGVELLESIMTELEDNERLLEDFPEVVYPFVRLEHITQRARGQTFEGEPTRIKLAKQEIVFPTIPTSAVSGSVFAVRGITGRIRGLKHKQADGTPIRPDLVIIDDPQTEESAASMSQCASRERTINGAILGLAGQKTRIAALMTLTVIQTGDMADRLLDRKLNPQWQAERTKMVYAWPTRTDLWDRYSELWHECKQNRPGEEPVEAYEFYRANQAAMDEGAVVAWPQCVVPGDISAIQTAYNKRLAMKDHAFWAECQNEPLPDADAPVSDLSSEQCAARTNGVARGVVPLGSSQITAFIDVQKDVLFWAVVAWSAQCSAAIIDYGAYPDQKRPYWTLGDVTKTLRDVAPGAGVEGALYAGLRTLIDRFGTAKYRREDGAEMGIDRAMIDANWGPSTDLVYQAIRTSPHSGLFRPSHGRYVGASAAPMSDWAKRDGDRLGPGWRERLSTEKNRAIRHVVYDTNQWKSFVRGRLTTAPGDRGAMTLCGRGAETHRMLADHLTSEIPVPTTARSRTIDEWKQTPGRDNHWLDCIVGCAVAASTLGVSLESSLGGDRPAAKSVGAAWRAAKERRGHRG